MPFWRAKPPGTWALPLAPFATVGESTVPSELEQLLVVHTSNVTVPLSFASGSPNAAVSAGVGVLARAPSAGLTSTGVLGARLAVLFVAAAPLELVAGLPLGGAVSRIIGSVVGFT